MKTNSFTTLLSDDIIELASRYVSVEKTNFPKSGELFSFMIREIPENKILQDDEGWRFSGYGLCRGYFLDEMEKPRGKWVYISYADLSRFPLTEQSLKLQPPHIVVGRFSTPDRTHQIKIEKCDIISNGGSNKSNKASGSKKQKNKDENQGKILKFPSQKGT